MALRDDLTEVVDAVYRARWGYRKGYVVPDDTSVTFGNEGVQLDGVVLYADLAESTVLVDNAPAWFAAEIYKTYLYCAARLITTNGGDVTAYDGDRIMGVFVGNGKEANAIEAALQLNHAVFSIINPLLNQHYAAASYRVKHGIGIDTGALMAAKTGARGANDLVWVGRAANHAAKLAAVRGYGSLVMTQEVRDALPVRLLVVNGRQVWEQYIWNEKRRYVYASDWVFPIG